MNDRFKFRVWNNKMQKFHIVFSMHGIVNDTLEGYAKDDNFVLEQCTGLKDVNGKLIYEGDIVELDDGTEINNAVIEWEEQSGQWVICTTDTTYTGTIYTFDNLYGNDLTVIGNIHNNADLIKVGEK